MAQQKNNSGLFVRIIPLLFFAVMAFVLITVVSTAVKLLYGYMAIPLLLIALVLNYSVVTDFFTGIVKGIKEDPGKGLIKAALAAAGYPFVFAYLAAKAYMKRTLGKKSRPKTNEREKDKGDYIKYEEVKEDPEDFLELEDIDKRKVKVKQTKSASENDNDYDDLFA